MKKVLFTLSLLFLTLCSSAATPKNIILFIGDGMATPQRMMADEFARKTGLPPPVMNRLPCHATTRTCSADSLVTDSAAAATAIACGEKTKNHALGVDAKGIPLVSCAEVAKANGKKVGIVTTVTINHATPGGFYAHRADRDESYAIGLDLLASGFDYFAGGGLKNHNEKKNKAYKGDIYDLAAGAGYRLIVRDKAAFDALEPGPDKVWYVAAKGEMPYVIDRQSWTNMPTLAEMTAVGLRLLDNPNGFFMMVEGGKIDYACHVNNAAAALRETLAFDEAVRVALDWQDAHPDTLVIVTGDHETGGMTLGSASSGYAFYVERLASRMSSDDKTPDDSGIGWTTKSHTGVPVLTTSKGPGTERFTGLIENTDIGNAIKDYCLPK